MSVYADELKSNQSNGLQSIPFKPWDLPGKPCIIYRKPRTLADARKVDVRSKGHANDAVIYTILLEALDENGDRLFDVGDKDFLESQHPSIVIELCNKLCAFIPREQQKKP